MLNLKAPENEIHMLQVKGFVEHEPDPDYAHTSDAAREAFLDMKYGVRIHWGLYTQWSLKNESWKFLKMSSRRRQAYQQLYQQFNPRNFSADAWMEFFQRCGFQCFAMTSKHHEGFSMFDTQTRVKRRVNWTAPGGPQIEDCNLAYSVMDTPFQRDIVGELTDSAHRHGIKVDLYFSHPDWYDADFRPYALHPLQTRRVYEHPEEYGAPDYVNYVQPPAFRIVPEPTAEEQARMMARHRAQLVELLTNYGKIDMLCLDQWLGKPVWPEMKETIKLLRQIQPDVMLRIRGIGNYGDYYTPEGVVPVEMAETDMPWMVIYPLGRSFSYEIQARYHKGAAWVIRNLIQCVATGGNFMVGIGPDVDGWFHPKAIEVLETVGEWLKFNGEAVYGTRPFTPWHEMDHEHPGAEVHFSQSKDGTTVYALCQADTWKGIRKTGRLSLASIPAREGMQVSLLGGSEMEDGGWNLAWTRQGEGVEVDVPKVASGRMGNYGGVFKFESMQGRA